MARHLRPAALLAAVAVTASLVTAASAAPPSRDVEEPAYRTLLHAAERPSSPNPYLSLLPTGVEPQYREWDRYLRAEARAARTAAETATAPRGPRTVVTSESEPVGTRGVNDTPATADAVPGFGSGADPEATITGDLALGSGSSPAVVPAAPEDDGDLTKATVTGLGPESAVRYDDATIGDGPHGSTGSGTGDFDVYAVDLAADETLVVDVDAFVDGSPLDSFVLVYDSTGVPVAEADGDDVDFYDALLTYTAGAPDTYFVVVGGWLSFLDDPFDSASGTGADSEGPYDVTLARTTLDVDVMAVELEAGDVLGATVLDFTASVGVIAPDGSTLMMRSFDDASFIYGAGSPLEGGGSHLAVVAEQAGTHYVTVRDGIGPWELRLQAFRPGVERFREGRDQVLFVDLDGATLDVGALFGFGPSAAELSPLSAFLPALGLEDQEDAVVDAILASVRETLADDLETAANDDFGVTILNSRDHADPFGSPNVSRLVVGGTIPELGIPTIGIAQSIDPGNFAPGETGVVLLDLLLAPSCDFGDELLCFAGPGTDVVDLVGTGVGNIVAHEAGHFLGSFHTEQFNEVPSIMDQGGNLPNTVGVGDDGVFGTGDDVDVDLVADDFVANEGFRGREDTRTITAFGLTTGRDVDNDAPTTAPDSFEFTGGPLVVGAPGVVGNDTDPEFDALLTTLATPSDRGAVDLAPTGGFTYTPTAFGPTTFSYTASDGDAVSAETQVDVVVRCGAEDGALRNGSFEVGITSWCRDSGGSDVPWRTAGVGENIFLDVYGFDFGFFLTEPTDGELAAVVGWDGLPGDLRLSQFLSVPANVEAAPLTFDWRAAWDLETYACPDCGLSDRELRAVVSDALTGEVLVDELLATAAIGTVEPDTGSQQATLDLTAFEGRFLRFDVVATVPDVFSGPAQLQVDAVRFVPDVDETPLGVGDAYAVAIGGELVVDAADGVLANDTDVEDDALTAELVDGPAHGTVDLAADGSFTYVHGGAAVLTDTFTYRVSDDRTTSGETTVVVRVGDDGMVRLAGDDRIATAVAISRSTFPSAGTTARAAGDPQASAVVLARADAFADGLAGTPLAASVDAPLLLTFPDALHPTTAAELERVLAPGGTVHLLGGEVALSNAVADAVTDLGYEVVRIAGTDRYETATLVAGELGDVGTILVTRGDDFPDALSAGPAAIATGGAIVLTPADAPVDVTTAFLAEHTDATTIAVGGPAARAYPDLDALSGPTRHETAVLVANAFFEDPAAVGIARSDVFVDALAGGVHVGRAGGPILITPSDELHPAVFAWLDTQADALRVGFAYGGPVALSDDVVTAAATRIR